jgi:beta-galactosidase/beta-glucuronidase
MMNRRGFLGTVCASAVLTAVPHGSSEKGGGTPSSSRRRIALNGEWERHLGSTLWDFVTVPSSLHPCGFYTLRRNFMLPPLTAGERVFLHLEGITYCGKLVVNRTPVGELGPYVPHEFELTRSAREANNEIELQMTDLIPWPDGTGKHELAIGVTRGWEAYGGIIRDAWAEIRPASFVENVRLAYQLDEKLESVNLRPRVIIASQNTGSCELNCLLLRDGTAVAGASRLVQLASGLNEIELSFDLRNVSLWSPDTPNLYELKTSLDTSDSHDTWACRTGFREIRTQGYEFLLNGKRLVLNGAATTSGRTRGSRSRRRKKSWTCR